MEQVVPDNRLDTKRVELVVILVSPQPYQPVCLLINQDFGWQAAGWLTRVSTSLGTSSHPAGAC